LFARFARQIPKGFDPGWVTNLLNNSDPDVAKLVRQSLFLAGDLRGLFLTLLIADVPRLGG
jgi:hypothetical protein